VLTRVTATRTTATTLRDDAQVAWVDELKVIEVCTRATRATLTRILSRGQLIDTREGDTVESCLRISLLICRVSDFRVRCDVATRLARALSITAVAGGTRDRRRGAEGVRVRDTRAAVIVDSCCRAVVALHTGLNGWRVFWYRLINTSRIPSTIGVSAVDATVDVIVITVITELWTAHVREARITLARVALCTRRELVSVVLDPFAARATNRGSELSTINGFIIIIGKGRAISQAGITWRGVPSRRIHTSHITSHYASHITGHYTSGSLTSRLIACRHYHSPRITHVDWLIFSTAQKERKKSQEQ
jgi:hypothetical protein